MHEQAFRHLEIEQLLEVFDGRQWKVVAISEGSGRSYMVLVKERLPGQAGYSETTEGLYWEDTVMHNIVEANSPTKVHPLGIFHVTIHASDQNVDPPLTPEQLAAEPPVPYADDNDTPF